MGLLKGDDCPERGRSVRRDLLICCLRIAATPTASEPDKAVADDVAVAELSVHWATGVGAESFVDGCAAHRENPGESGACQNARNVYH